MKKNKPSLPVINDFVAKHMNTFNRSSVEVDRKARAKSAGYANTKHKGCQDW